MSDQSNETPAPLLPLPSLGRIVLVRTHGAPINDQTEHAAIITQVWGPTCINCTIFPGVGAPFNGSSVMHESTTGYGPSSDLSIGSVTWRWPPRV